MANPGDVLLGVSGGEITLCPFGRTFTKRIIEGAREDRTVNGRLIKDIKWRKWTFRLAYSLISGNALADYQRLWDMQTELSLIWVDADGTVDTRTVQMTPFDSTRVILISDGLWRGFSTELREV